MRMFMLAVLMAAVFVPVCSMAQVPYTPAPTPIVVPPPNYNIGDTIYRNFKQGQEIGRSLAPLFQKPQPQPPPESRPTALSSSRQPEEPVLDYMELTCGQGFLEYLKSFLKVKSKEDVRFLVTKRQRFLGFTDAALKRGRDELRLILLLTQTTKDDARKKQ